MLLRLFTPFHYVLERDCNFCVVKGNVLYCIESETNYSKEILKKNFTFGKVPLPYLKHMMQHYTDCLSRFSVYITVYLIDSNPSISLATLTCIYKIMKIDI